MSKKNVRKAQAQQKVDAEITREYVGGALNNQKVSVGMGDGTRIEMDQAELFAKLGLKLPAVSEYTIERFGSDGPGDPDDPLTPFGVAYQNEMRAMNACPDDVSLCDFHKAHGIVALPVCPGKEENGEPCNTCICFCEECGCEAADGTYTCPNCGREEATR